MLGKNGQVKLIDFNLSTMFSTDPSRKLTESVGCIHYASPQILEAAHRIPYSASNGWSDVWSFGVVVFALLQGVFPFKELTPTKLHAEIQKRGGKNLTFPVPISWEAKNFITDVLDPYRRWSARELLSHPFIVGVAAPIWDEVQTPIQNSSSLAVPGEKTRSRSAPGTSMEYQQQQPQPVPQQMQQQGTRPRFQIPMPSPGPMHPSVALLKEQLPAPRTPNANMDISTMGGNYFNIQPLPTPSISQNQQSQLHYFEQPRSPHMPNGMPAVGTPSLFQGYQPPLASPAAPPFRGLQWTAHSRSRAESIQYGNSAPLETPALRQDAENPEAMAVDVLMNLDQPQMVPTPPATPNHMVDYMSPSPPEQTTSFAAPLPPNVNGHGQGMILPSPSTPGPVPVRSPGPASNEPGSSGWKNQLAALNNYSKMLMRDAAAKLASVSGEAEQIPPEPAQDAAGLTRLQKAAWKMGVHNLVN